MCNVIHYPRRIFSGLHRYNPDENRNRNKSELKKDGVVQSVRYYHGNYEKLETYSAGALSSTKHIYYISGGNGLCAIATKEGSNPAVTYTYVYTDHLGSILKLTNSSGTVLNQQSFDAWGRLRNPNNWNDYSIAGTTQLTNSPFGAGPPPSGGWGGGGWLTRGYTGHEHVPQVDLINMNGRMYDAVLGRMLSPDNYVSDVTGTQAYNRYTYVNNNPLKYTDPSGWLAYSKAFEPALERTGGGSGGGGGSWLDLTGGVSGYNYMGSYSMYVSSPDFYAAIYGTQTWMQSATNKAYIMSCIRDAINMLNGPSQVHIRRKGNTGLPGEVRDVKPRTWYFGSDDNQNDLDMSTATACNGCDNIGLNTGAPRTGFFNNTLNYINNHKLDIIGTFGGATEYELGRRLSQPMFKFYQPLRLSAPGWSKYSSKIEPFASEFLSLSKYAKSFKIGGAVLGGIGLLSSGYGIIDGIVQRDNAKIFENSLDLIMGGVGFIPGWGWAASGAYFLIAKPLYNHYIRKEDEP